MKRSMIKFLYNRTMQIMVLLVFFCMMGYSQPTVSELNQSITEIRKGELTVKTKAGEQIIIEQVRHEFWFGCSISEEAFNGSMSETNVKLYKEKFLENFNSAATQNALKWKYMERERGKVDYSVVDAILAWTTEHQLPLRGHNIYWGVSDGNVVPNIQPWLKELNNQELEQAVQKRGETLASYYKGRFAEYDLNNEMIHGNFYQDRLGPDITKRMTEWVHKGDPDAKLYLNDYDITTGRMLVKYLAHINTLLKQDVTIAGIGVQGHLHGETFDRLELQRALDSLAKFDLPICITEFNIPGQRSKYMRNSNLKMTAEEEVQNAKELVDFYRICFAHPNVKGIVMWGFWAMDNWIPVSSIYREDWSVTPAADAYKDLIFREWWTKETGETDCNGNFSTSAFYGKYKITVGNVSKIVDLDKASGKMMVDFTK